MLTRKGIRYRSVLFLKKGLYSESGIVILDMSTHRHIVSLENKKTVKHKDR